MTTFRFTVEVDTDSREHAEEAIGNRLAYTMDYGFAYKIDHRFGTAYEFGIVFGDGNNGHLEHGYTVTIHSLDGTETCVSWEGFRLVGSSAGGSIGGEMLTMDGEPLRAAHAEAWIPIDDVHYIEVH